MTALPVRMTIHWQVPMGRARSMTDAIHLLMPSTRTQPGCVGCSVSTDMGESSVIRYSEEWRSEDALQRQFQTERFRSLIALVEDALEPPFVEFVLRSEERRVGKGW